MSVPQRAWVAEMVETLAEEVRRIEGTRRVAPAEVVSTGSQALDRLLPGGGFRRGTLVEWLAGSAASGAATLALYAAAQAARAGGAVVVIDEQASFYPPAALALGIDLEQLIVVRPAGKTDHHWAIDQVLRSRGVAAVWCAPGPSDDHTLRRWQLAAESSGVVGMLLRPEQARDEPSWAELRLGVAPCRAGEPLSASPTITGRQACDAGQLVASRRALDAGQLIAGRRRRLRVELVRARQAEAGKSTLVELPCRDVGPAVHDALRSNPDETRPVHLASSLAAAKTRRRSRRA
jgi:hypothetical protein